MAGLLIRDLHIHVNELKLYGMIENAFANIARQRTRVGKGSGYYGKSMDQNVATEFLIHCPKLSRSGISKRGAEDLVWLGNNMQKLNSSDWYATDTVCVLVPFSSSTLYVIY